MEEIGNHEAQVVVTEGKAVAVVEGRIDDAVKVV